MRDTKKKINNKKKKKKRHNKSKRRRKTEKEGRKKKRSSKFGNIDADHVFKPPFLIQIMCLNQKFGKIPTFCKFFGVRRSCV